MLSRRCNLRCDYRYVPRTDSQVLSEADAERAIERAADSTRQGGRLEVAFFGGEPLLHAGKILSLADFARRQTARRGLSLAMHLTTNGTVAEGDAWTVLAGRDFDIAVSFDGQPEVHDRHRRTRDGGPSSGLVLTTLKRLIDIGRGFTVIVVVRPDTVADLASGVEFLLELGVTSIHPALDIWAAWDEPDLAALDAAVTGCAELWRPVAGRAGISWLDRMAARVAGLDGGPCARCGFGAGAVAVAPSGGLYPCERIIGHDADDQPHRLTGHVRIGEDFLGYPPQPSRDCAACRDCTIADLCDTTCRCSNFVRTGDAARPDALLCRLNRACHREIMRLLAPTERNTP